MFEDTSLLPSSRDPGAAQLDERDEGASRRALGEAFRVAEVIVFLTDTLLYTDIR